MTLVRRLNDAGIQRLSDFIDSLRRGLSQGVPTEILTHPDTSEALGEEIDVEQRTFTNRLEAARYLHNRFVASGLRNIERDQGIWSWLALFYFDQLCPPRANQVRDPGEAARFVFPTNRFYYRHLLAGPFLIFRAHLDRPERALVVLCGPIHEISKFVSQFASRQELVTNKAVMELATKLYIDPEKRVPKRRSRTDGPGGPRRLAEFLYQLDITWDLHSLSTEMLMERLPDEFDAFSRAT